MAHRHAMQRKRGGRTVYEGAGSNVAKEAGDTSEGFKRGGRHHVGHAFGGKVKKRADGGRTRKEAGGPITNAGFKSGGKVWSKAAGGIRGTRGFAAPIMKHGKTHGEAHDSSVRGTAGHSPRTGHSGRAGHQEHAAGGVVGFDRGGPAGRTGSASREGRDDDDDGESDEEKEGSHRADGGVAGFKKGGHAKKLKMHYLGGKGRKGRAEGGPAEHEPDADIDDVGGRAGMAKGGGCWMEKAFAGSHGQFKAKAKKAGMSTGAYASKEADSPSASTKTKRQANLAKIGAEYGGGG